MSQPLELKFAVGPAFVLPDLTGAGSVARMQAMPSRDLRSTYYDTVDRRLARWGITLRHRTGDGDRAPWTLKLPLPAVAVDGVRPASRSEIDLEGPADAVPDMLADLVTAHVRAHPLTVAAILATQRTGWRLVAFDGQVVAELTTDDVLVMDGDEVTSQFTELELEARRASAEDLAAVSARLLAAGAVGAAPVPTAIRALGPGASGLPDIVLREFSPEDAAGWAVRAALADALLRIVKHDPGTRLGDEEALHQFRVGVRRLRSDLRTLRSLLGPDWAPGLNSDLKRLGSLLGAVRDLDVLLTHLVSTHGDLMTPLGPMLTDLRRRHATARTVLLEELRSDRYAQLLERLVVLARDPELSAAGLEPAGEVLPALAAKSWRRLERRVEKMSARPRPTDTDLHAVRIAAKRARYAAELAARGVPEGRAEEARGFAAELAGLQDLLGRHQDAVVAVAETHAAAAGHADDLELIVAAGRVIERELQAARRERHRFAETWRSVSRRRHRRWMEA
ncbi:MAG TPA: CYTH and CHAD domain-containing protein [Candidatus Limnocylindria bacterium]|nr:CYTH and CHAD domain-containing protein [Candidatus Limnocylindria bacterium]